MITSILVHYVITLLIKVESCPTLILSESLSNSKCLSANTHSLIFAVNFWIQHNYVQGGRILNGILIIICRYWTSFLNIRSDIKILRKNFRNYYLSVLSNLGWELLLDFFDDRNLFCNNHFDISRGFKFFKFLLKL